MSPGRPAPPLQQRSPRAGEIIRSAYALVEAEGPEALTMRRLGEELGIRAPSLYKHLPGKDALTGGVVELAMLQMGTALHAAIGPVSGDAAAGEHGTSPAARIERLLSAYRQLALDHPHLYRLATTGPLTRELLPPGLEDWAGEPFWLVTGDPAVAQALWSAAHGTVILELDERYPAGSDLDRTWAALTAAFAGTAAGIETGPVPDGW